MDLSQVNGHEEEWYDIPGKGWEGARIQLRKPRPREIEAAVKKHSRRRFKRGQVYEWTETDKFTPDLVEMSVVGWEGIERDGQPLEVNTENKVWLLGEYENVRALWSAVIEKDVEIEQALAEAERKN